MCVCVCVVFVLCVHVLCVFVLCVCVHVLCVCMCCIGCVVLGENGLWRKINLNFLSGLAIKSCETFT